jgi:hypothetical protein
MWGAETVKAPEVPSRPDSSDCAKQQILAVGRKVVRKFVELRIGAPGQFIGQPGLLRSAAWTF